MHFLKFFYDLISLRLKITIEEMTKRNMCTSKMTPEKSIALRFSMDPTICSLFSLTVTSKNPFQPSMWLVNRNGFRLLKMGRSSVFNMVKTMMMLMVAMIGPIEFSAKRLRKKLSADTVNSAMAANKNAARYRHITSDDMICEAESLLRMSMSSAPKTIIEIPRA
jgi:hypothetical protein